jgi:cell division septal protein FtsQ
MTKREYRRTAALLGAQPRAAQHQRSRNRARIEVPWRLLAGILLLAALALWSYLDPRWYVGGTRLQVAGALSPETVYEVGAAADVMGFHGAWLRPKEIITRVHQAVPYVTDVDADCWFYPAQCLITVQESRPVLVWRAPGETYWVTAEGAVFSARGEQPHLPVLHGPLPTSECVPLTVLEGVEALLDLGLAQEELTYHPRRGIVWTDPEGRQVALGTGGDMAHRLRVYEVLVADFEAEGIQARQLDVSVPEAPTYSVERTW